MKGIVLAGGSGTRLQPMTHAISKQLLPVYDKPMIYYPLSVLMQLGMQEILIISTPRDIPMIRQLLGDGAAIGLQLHYAEQAEPNGIAEAFIIGETFIGEDSVCLILGDNIFYGSEIFGETPNMAFMNATRVRDGGYVMAFRVRDPQRYGVIELAKDGRTALSIEEKPTNPKSPWAVTGLYFYDSSVVQVAKSLTPSARGELEITDINRHYLREGKLNVIPVGRGFAWLDAGTPDSLMESAQFVYTVEKRQSVKVACLEEIALRKGFITRDQFIHALEQYKMGSDYRHYLESVLRDVAE